FSRLDSFFTISTQRNLYVSRLFLVSLVSWIDKPWGNTLRENLHEPCACGIQIGALRSVNSQGLGFYHRAWNELDVVAHELDCPFRNPSHGVAVADNFSEWKRGDDRHLMLGEVVL